MSVFRKKERKIGHLTAITTDCKQKDGQTHLQTSQHSVLHHAYEFLMTQAVVSVHVKEFKNSIQHIVRQIVACGDLYSSLELG